MKNRAWFIKNGFLCIPSTWQGFLVLLAYITLMSFGFFMMDHEWVKNLSFMALFTVVLLWIFWKKGEKKIWIIPKWKS